MIFHWEGPGLLREIIVPGSTPFLNHFEYEYDIGGALGMGVIGVEFGRLRTFLYDEGMLSPR